MGGWWDLLKIIINASIDNIKIMIYTLDIKFDNMLPGGMCAIKM